MDLKQAAEKGFDGADIEALRAYCTRLGVEFKPSNNAASLKKKLKAALMQYQEVYAKADPAELSDDDAADETTIDQVHMDALGLTRLNLRAQGKWEGRRRIIQLHRAMSHESIFPQFFAWGQLHCYVPFGLVAHLPYPIFNILKDTAGSRLIRKRKVDDEGRIFYKEEWVPSQRFMFTDMGDDPATADKPTDVRDMVRRLQVLTDDFAGFSARQFKELCHRLNIIIKPDWDDTDLKAAIKARCQILESRVDLSRPDVAAAEAAA